MTTQRITTSDKHAQLVDAGWTTRLDGRLRPPTSTGDQRAHTLAAAWHARTEQTASKTADRPPLTATGDRSVVASRVNADRCEGRPR